MSKDCSVVVVVVVVVNQYVQIVTNTEVTFHVFINNMQASANYSLIQ